MFVHQGWYPVRHVRSGFPESSTHITVQMIQPSDLFKHITRHLFVIHWQIGLEMHAREQRTSADRVAEHRARGQARSVLVAQVVGEVLVEWIAEEAIPVVLDPCSDDGEVLRPELRGGDLETAAWLEGCRGWSAHFVGAAWWRFSG